MNTELMNDRIEKIEAILDRYNPMNLPISHDENPYPIEYWDCAQDIEYILKTTPPLLRSGHLLSFVLYGVFVANCGHCVVVDKPELDGDYWAIADEIIDLYKNSTSPAIT